MRVFSQPIALVMRQASSSIVLGIGLGSLFLDALLQKQLSLIGLGIFGAALSITAMLMKRKPLMLIGLLMLGCWYVPFRAALLSIPFSNIYQSAGVIHFVEPLLGKQRLIVRLEEPHALSGKDIFVYTERFPEHAVGEQVELHCALEQPEPIQDFAFERYAERRGIVAVCRYPKLVVVGYAASVASALDRLRAYYADIFTRSMPAAEDSLLQAMVLNKTGEFPANLLASFAASGLSHSISISGLHMSLLIVAVELILGALGLSRRMRLLVLILGLSAYLVLLGFPSPAVRSCIMGVLMIWGTYAGRQAQGTHILVLTATVMLLQNPLLLGFDVGFQLSCLALLGMGLTNAHWNELLSFLPERFAIREVFAATCSAQFYTWPLTLYYFGTFSFIAPIANAVILPLLPLLLSLAFVVPLLSFVPFIYPVGLVFLFSVTKLMNSLVVFFGSIPYASLQQVHITSAQALAALSLLAATTCIWHLLALQQHNE